MGSYTERITNNKQIMTKHLLSKFILWAFALLTLPAAGQGLEKDAAGNYLINTKEDLWAFAKQVNEGNTFEKETILLTDDISLGCNEENQWTPIGTFNTDTPFKGTFDGQNHTISGIYINDEWATYQGLFGSVAGGTIQNLSVADSYIKAFIGVGGIVGNFKGTVSNCFYSGTVIGNDEVVGGIVGDNNSGTVSNCSNSGTVTASSGNVGGIVGLNYSGTVSNCTNSGTVTGSNAGGIVGMNANNGTVSNSYYLATACEAGIGNNNNTTLGAVPSEEDMKKTAEEYASGVVAHLLNLNQTEEVWGQRIGTDAYPVLLSALSEEERAAYKIYTVTFTYKETPDAEEETKIIQYGNSGTTITAPIVTPVEGYTFAWDKEVPTHFGTANVTVTGTFTKDEEPEPEEPTEPEEESDVPHITYYDIRFVQPNDSVNFDSKSDQVREGNTFSFSALAAEGYDPKTLVVEYRRGPVGIWREATLDTDGRYHIRANYADLYIRARVEPLVPTGIEQVGDEAIEVYTDNGTICVYTPSEERVIIVSMSGAVVRMEEQVGKRSYTGLSDGVYIVRVGERSYKVRL